jgi:hypothetical protein
MHIFVFLVLYLKAVSLSCSKIMKKSPITEYSVPHGPQRRAIKDPQIMNSIVLSLKIGVGMQKFFIGNS